MTWIHAHTNSQVLMSVIIAWSFTRQDLIQLGFIDWILEMNLDQIFFLRFYFFSELIQKHGKFWSQHDEIESTGLRTHESTKFFNVCFPVNAATFCFQEQGRMDYFCMNYWFSDIKKAFWGTYLRVISVFSNSLWKYKLNNIIYTSLREEKNSNK